MENQTESVVAAKFRNLSHGSTGHTMYSLEQHRQFYDTNYKAVKTSKRLVENIKNVHANLLRSVEERKLRPEQISLRNSRNSRKTKSMGSKELMKLQQLASKKTIGEDSDRKKIEPPKTKKWEFLKYKGSRFTPQVLLKMTRKTEFRHGRNVNNWTVALKKNNNIDYDAKKSYENLKKRIDFSTQTVSRIKFGGLSLFDEPQEDDTNNFASTMSNLNQSMNKAMNVPILENENYKKCISQFARTQTPGQSLDSTKKRWFQMEKNLKPSELSDVSIENPLDDEQDMQPKKLEKMLDFPNNPAFFPDKGDFMRRKLKSAIQYCKEQNIPMNQKQQICQNVKHSQHIFQRFSSTVGEVYRGKSISEAEFLIQKLRNSFVYTDTNQELEGALLNIDLDRGSHTRRKGMIVPQSPERKKSKDQMQNYEQIEIERQDQLVRLSDYLQNPGKYKFQEEKSRTRLGSRTLRASTTKSRQRYGSNIDGTRQIAQATKNTQSNKTKLSAKLNEILNRVELDRPILFKEKLDVIWNANIISQKQETVKGKSVNASRNIRRALDNKKKDRLKINQDQRFVYRKLLSIFRNRAGSPLEDEIQLLNVIKIIIDGGWVITEDELNKLLEVLKIPTQNQSNHQQFMEFLRTCVEELKMAQFMLH